MRRRRRFDPTSDPRFLEPRLLLDAAQPPPVDVLDPSYLPPDPGPPSSAPGDYPATDPGLC